ncbi:MAG: transporter, partial [Tangfeifania sp.]
TAADMRLAFAHTLTETFSLSYNLGAEWNGESAIPGYFYSVAAGIGITKSVGMFVESYGLIPETGQPEHLLDAGFTLLLLANLQLDISGGIGLNEHAADHFISFGLSYRLPE